MSQHDEQCDWIGLLSADGARQAPDVSEQELLRRFAALAASILRVPLASISLADADGNGFKVSAGADTTMAGECRDCPQARLTCDGPIICTNCLSHEELCQSPAVRECGMRFYAGFPILDEAGRRIALLCLKDTQPREFDEAELRRVDELVALARHHLQTHTSAARVVERDALLKGVLGGSLDGVMCFRPVRSDDGRIVDFEWTLINPAAERLLRIRASEHIGRRLLDEMPGTQSEGLFERYVQVVETGAPVRFEHFHGVRQDGVTQWFEVAAVRVGDDGLALTVSDISELKRMDEQHRNHVQFLQTLLDTIPNPIFYKAVDGRYLGCNAAFERMLGVPRERIVGATVHDLCGDELADRYAAMDAALFGQTGSQVYEAVVNSPDGRRDVIFHKATYQNGLGELAGMVGVVTDITERKHSEETLREQEQKYRTLFEHSADAHFLMTDVFTDCNERACEMWGATRDQIIGQSPALFSPPMQPDGRPSLEAARERIEAALAGVPQYFAWQHRRIDTGAVLDCEVSLVALTLGGQEMLHAAVRDVSQRRATERALAARLQVEAGVAACSRVLLSGEFSDEALSEALQRLREGTGADRVTYFENYEDAVEGPCARLRLEACADGVIPAAREPHAQRVSLTRHLPDFAERLSAGEAVWGDVAEMPPRERALLGAAGLQSALALPVRVDGAWHGFVGFDSVREPRAWSDDDVRLLHTAAEMIGTYVGRKRAQQALAWEVEVNASLAALARAMISAANDREIGARVLDTAQRLTGSACGFVGYLDPESGHLVVPTMSAGVHEQCKIPHNEPAVFTDFNSLWGWALRNRRPIVSNNPAKDRRAKGLPAGHIPLERFLAVPAMVNQRLVGLVALANAPRDYERRDRELLERMAALYAIAAEHALSAQRTRASEARYRLLAENSSDLISRLDVHGHVAYVSPASRMLLGYDPDELAGRNWHEMVHPQDVVMLRTSINETAVQGAPRNVEYRVKTADGAYIWVESSVRVEREALSGQVQEIVLASRDVSSRKRSEQELQSRAMALNALNMELQAQKQQLQAQQIELEGINRELEAARDAAEEASRAKSAFLANMSHEIRTPMTAILGYADLIGENGLDDSEQRRHLDTVRRNGEHLLRIINDVLDISKIEAGKMEVERVPCSPIEIVNEVVSLMGARAVEKQLALEVEYRYPTPTEVRSDPVRLRQILVNLVGNAVKFTEQGRVCIGVGYRVVGERHILEFEVRDTGIGMSDAQITRLFQPFTQADVSTTRKFGGTGLGLIISRRLAEMLGGEIRVESTPEVGSCFKVTIDAGRVAPEKLLSSPDQGVVKTAAGDRQELPRLSGRALLAEDGVDNQRLIRLVLQKAGLVVDVVENGAVAVQHALSAEREGRPYNLILMDMQMPVMDGYAATRELRCNGYAGPIVALTAHAMSGDRQQCLDAGCDDYATKPINRRSLLELCASWIARGSAARVAPAPPDA